LGEDLPNSVLKSQTIQTLIPAIRIITTFRVERPANAGDEILRGDYPDDPAKTAVSYQRPTGYSGILNSVNY
jgi:hypothetical protein